MKCIIHVTTVAGAKNLKETLATYKEFASDYDVKFLIVDQSEDDPKLDEINDCEIKYAYQITDNSFYKKAFTFTQNEFTDYVSLIAVKYFFDKGYENIALIKDSVKLLSNLDTLNEYAADELDTITFLHGHKSALVIDETIDTAILKDSEADHLFSCVLLNKGEKVISYLTWCIRQIDQVYYHAY